MGDDRLVAFTVAGLCFIGWAIYLGGLASVQELCENDNLYTFALLDAGGLWSCKRYLGLYWWFMCYQLGIIIALVALAKKLPYFRPALTTAYGVAFIFFTFSTDKFLANAKRPYWLNASPAKQRMNALVVGCIFLTVFDGVAMFALGGMSTYDYDEGPYKPRAAVTTPPV